MMLDTSNVFAAPLSGFGRTPSEQALENLAQALRALELAPCSDSELCPHPLVVVRAEIENARRYLMGTARKARAAAKSASSEHTSALGVYDDAEALAASGTIRSRSG